MHPAPGIKGVPSELEDLPFYLVRVAVAFRRMNDCTLREVGLKPQPLGAGSVLYVLFNQKRCTVKTLVEKTEIPNGTLTGVLDGLERDGLIRRMENAEDGRSWLIQLAPKGEALREKLVRRHKVTKDLFEGTLSPKETDIVKSALHRLTKAMNDYTGMRLIQPTQKKRKNSTMGEA